MSLDWAESLFFASGDMAYVEPFEGGMLPIEAELHRREMMEGRAAEDEVEEVEGARRASCLAVERSMVGEGEDRVLPEKRRARGT